MKKRTSVLLSIIGFLLIAIGLYWLKHFGAAQGMSKPLPYVAVGIGCGAFGHGVGELVSRRALKDAPDVRKQREIEQNDERNQAISNRAKGKAYDAMLYIFGALMVSLALMQLNMTALLLLVFAYLVVVGISIYYRCKFEKEM